MASRRARASGVSCGGVPATRFSAWWGESGSGAESKSSRGWLLIETARRSADGREAAHGAEVPGLWRWRVMAARDVVQRRHQSMPRRGRQLFEELAALFERHHRLRALERQVHRFARGDVAAVLLRQRG